jgi:hypothetical protein
MQPNNISPKSASADCKLDARGLVRKLLAWLMTLA